MTCPQEYPRVVIFASGGKKKGQGGSGARKLLEAVMDKRLHMNPVAVVSNNAEGGVHDLVEEFRERGMDIEFVHFPGPWTADNYQAIIEKYKAEFVLLSGWLKPIRGHNPAKTINIHPGILPKFGGKGMHGHHVHQATIDAKMKYSAVTVHFVDNRYDHGPIIFQFLVEVLPDDTAETLGKRVNKAEHYWQWQVTEWVVTGKITWDGKDPKSLRVDIPNYPFFPAMNV